MERLLAWYRVGSSYGGRRRADRCQPRSARRRPLVRLGRLGDPHHLLAGERHLRAVQRPEDAAGRGAGGRLAGGGAETRRRLNGYRVNGRPPSGTDKAALIPFFIMHYGIFWVVHGLFVLTLPLFEFTGADGEPDFGTTLNPLAILFVARRPVHQPRRVVPPELHRPRRIPANDRGPADVRAVRSAGRPPRHDHLRRGPDRR